MAKGTICMLKPEAALRSMEQLPSRNGYLVGGAVLIAIGGWAAYCAWHGGAG